MNGDKGFHNLLAKRGKAFGVYDQKQGFVDPFPLTVCLMYERGLGSRSKFAPYLNLMAEREQGVPFTW